jgi:hypothetical protein
VVETDELFGRELGNESKQCFMEGDVLDVFLKFKHEEVHAVEDLHPSLDGKNTRYQAKCIHNVVDGCPRSWVYERRVVISMQKQYHGTNGKNKILLFGLLFFHLLCQLAELFLSHLHCLLHHSTLDIYEFLNFKQHLPAIIFALDTYDFYR